MLKVSDGNFSPEGLILSGKKKEKYARGKTPAFIKTLISNADLNFDDSQNYQIKPIRINRDYNDNTFGALP